MQQTCTRKARDGTGLPRQARTKPHRSIISEERRSGAYSIFKSQLNSSLEGLELEVWNIYRTFMPLVNGKLKSRAGGVACFNTAACESAMTRKERDLLTNAVERNWPRLSLRDASRCFASSRESLFAPSVPYQWPIELTRECASNYGDSALNRCCRVRI